MKKLVNNEDVVDEDSSMDLAPNLRNESSADEMDENDNTVSLNNYQDYQPIPLFQTTLHHKNQSASMNDKIEVMPQFEIHNVNDNDSDDEALPPKEREQIKIHRVSYLSKGRQGK